MPLLESVLVTHAVSVSRFTRWVQGVYSHWLLMRLHDTVTNPDTLPPEAEPVNDNGTLMGIN